MKSFRAALAVGVLLAWGSLMQVRAEEPGSTTFSGVIRADAEAMESREMLGEYWLGLAVSPPSPALQSQLKLAKNEGLVVDSVQPDSPAAKAGIQQHDVLLKANDKPLSRTRDLIELINQGKEAKLTLEMIRAGKRETIAATPAKRPATEPLVANGVPAADINAMRAWVQKIDPTMHEGQAMQFHIVGPGQILPPGGPHANRKVTIKTEATLADGYRVEITRHDADPAQVVVTQGKEKWEGTDKDLSKIPEKVRGDVEKMLRPQLEGIHVFATGESSIEHRLNDMQKQIDELRKRLDAGK